MKRITLIPVLLCTLVISYGCHSHSKYERIVTEWTGKKIVFPSQEITPESLCNQEKAPYSILYYVDAKTCLQCRIKSWDRTISNMEKKIGHRIVNCMYISQDCDDNILEITAKMPENRPTFIDEGNVFISINSIPGDDLMNVLLLDSCHNTIVIGNPIIGDKMYDLFIQAIVNLEKEL